MSAVTQRYIDMWAFPGLHPTNLELLQRLKTADDRQFGSGMDVCGEVSQFNRDGGWEKVAVAGVRSDLWNPDPAELEKALQALQKQRRQYHRRRIRKSGALSDGQQERLNEQLSRDVLLSLSSEDIEKRRLVMKLFRTTGQRLRWSGTIEEVTTREIHNSIGSHRAVLSMVAILPSYEYMTTIQENHRTFRIPPLYTLCFHDERQHRTWHIMVKRRWFSIGADYVIESAGKRIGEIDGKLIGLGYNAYLTVTEPSLADNDEFVELMTLFATSVGYHRAMRRSLRRRLAVVSSGSAERHIIEDEEWWLLKNPRRRAA